MSIEGGTLFSAIEKNRSPGGIISPAENMFPTSGNDTKGAVEVPNGPLRQSRLRGLASASVFTDDASERAESAAAATDVRRSDPARVSRGRRIVPVRQREGCARRSARVCQRPERGSDALLVCAEDHSKVAQAAHDGV